MEKSRVVFCAARGADKGAVMDLWKYCFADSEAFVDYYFSKRYSSENTMVLKDGQGLLAALQLNPYNLVIGDEVTEVKYIVGVSVQPEARGKGYMSMLMKKTINHLYETGDEISLLMPIDTKLYTGFGFENCFLTQEFLMDLQRIHPKRSKYQIKRIDIDSVDNLEGDIHYLNEIYYEVAARHHMFVSRNSRYWKNRFGELAVEGAQLFMVFQDLQPKGYVILVPKGNNETGMVVEMVFADYEAYYDILGLIKSHGTQFNRALIVTPQPMEFDLMCQFDNQIQRKIKPMMMARVIHGEKVLDRILYKRFLFGSGLEIEGSKDLPFSIQLTDDIIQENNFVVRGKGQTNLGVYRSEMDNHKEDIHLGLSISALTQLYAKAATVKQLVRLGKIQIDKKNIPFFEEIFGNKLYYNFINDYI